MVNRPIVRPPAYRGVLCNGTKNHPWPQQSVICLWTKIVQVSFCVSIYLHRSVKIELLKLIFRSYIFKIIFHSCFWQAQFFLVRHMDFRISPRLPCLGLFFRLLRNLDVLIWAFLVVGVCGCVVLVPYSMSGLPLPSHRLSDQSPTHPFH